MACRDEITGQILFNIKDIIGVNRTSVRELSGNKILLAINENNPSLLTKANTVKAARQIANKINSIYKSNLYGTVVYVNTNKYTHGTELTWEIPSKLVDAYENMNNDVDYLPSATTNVPNRYQKEIDNIQDRIRTLSRNLSNSRDDKTKRADLSSKIKILEDRKIQLENEDKLSDVIAYGNSDMKDVNAILTKDKISLSDLFYANKIIQQWKNAVNEIFDKNDLMQVEGQYSPNVQAVENIEKQADKAERLYTEVFENTVIENYKLQGVNPTRDQIFGAKKEINFLASNMRDISTTDDIVFQVTSKLIKDANYDTEQEVIKLDKEVNALFDAVKKTAEYKKDNFNIFTRLQDVPSSDKKTTVKKRVLVTRFSQDYYDNDKKLRMIAKKANNTKTWKDYFSWKRENTIVFDSRKLFNDVYNELDGEVKYSQEAITDHINDLKQQLGENGYQEYLKGLEEKIELYKEDLEANKIFIDALEEDQAVKDSMLQEWVLRYSPFVYAKSVETNTVEKLGDKFIKPRGLKYTTEVPRRFTKGLKKTNWYDSKFEAIESNPALYKYYNYTIGKFQELSSYLPEDKIENLQENYIPEVRKNIAELFSDIGAKGGMNGWYDKIIAELTTEDLASVSNAERDPVTGKVIKRIPVSMVGDKLTADEKSNDLVKITKAFAIMSLSYKHKAKIEDAIRINQQIVNAAEEMEVNATGTQVTDNFGRPKSTKDGLKYYRAQFEYAVDSMIYGERKELEGVSKNTKLLNTEEKAVKKQLEVDLKAAKEEDKQPIQDQIDALGSNLVASSVWDKLLQFAQIKGMGWNLFAPITNVAFAEVGNIIHAAGGEDFNINQYFKSKAIMLHSIGKSFSLDSIKTKTSMKVNTLMENWNVVGEIDQIGYKSTAFESTTAKGLKKLAPYELTRRAEFLNQGTTFVAMMLGYEVKDNNGKLILNKEGKPLNLWEAYDEKGNWKTSEYGPEISLEARKAFKNKLEQVKKLLIHGNYDPLSAVKIKKTVLGRSLIMFRSWVAEGFASRFEKETELEDIHLGRKRKGRYITLKEQGLVQGPLLILSQMANFLTFGGAFKTSLDKLSPLDKANMRKNAAEVMLYLTIYAVVLMLKAASSDDDDEKKALNATLNVLFRVQNDMAFFTSPLAFEKITQSSIPAMSIVTDAAKLVQATQKTIMGDPYYKNGNHRGESRIKVNLGKNIPFFNQGIRASDVLYKVNE